MPLYTIKSKQIDGRQRAVSEMHFHPGQLKAWYSDKRIVAIIAGARSGKTSFIPWWLSREIRRMGPGDYLIAAPSLQIIDKAAGPEVDEVLGRIMGLGATRTGPRQFILNAKAKEAIWRNTPFAGQASKVTRILYGHADDPESLESMTIKAACLDEPGQKKFKRDSWEAVVRRVSTDQGRILITTTPYFTGGWLEQLIFNPWRKAKGAHPDIDVFQFASNMNPAYPAEEWAKAKRDLPAWKFAMFHLGQFERPAGLIYHNFDPDLHVVPRFTVPEHWPRVLGMDFGGINTAGIFLARELKPFEGPVKGHCGEEQETGRVIAYREYLEGNRTAKEHAEHLLRGEPRIPTACGGSKSEQQWRDEFRRAGLPIKPPPISEVEVGIDRVFGMIANGQLIVMDHLEGLLGQLGTYSREVDDAGEPTEKIADKSSAHWCDSLRYIAAYLKHPKKRLEVWL